MVPARRRWNLVSVGGRNVRAHSRGPIMNRALFHFRLNVEREEPTPAREVGA